MVWLGGARIRNLLIPALVALPMPDAGDGSPEPQPAAQSPANSAAAIGPRGSRHRIEPKIGAVA